MERLSDVRDAFTQLWGTLGPFWGVSPTTARIFGWLLSQPEGADAEEIMNGLELSRGAVSMGCRELREWGLVYLEKAPGSRRQIYVPESDLLRVTRNVAQIRKRREWDPIREHLAEWIPALEADSSPEAVIFAERLRAIEALVVMADSMAEVLLTGGSIGNFGIKALLRATETVTKKATAKNVSAGKIATKKIDTETIDTEAIDTEAIAAEATETERPVSSTPESV